jgi:hypothetical protein
MLFTDIEKRWQSAMNSYELAKSGDRAASATNGSAEAPAEEVRQVFYAKSSPLFLDERRVDQYIERNNNLRNELQKLQRLVNDTKLSHPGSPPRAQVLEDSEKPRDSFVMLPGNPGSKGPVVPRQFFEVLSNGGRQPFKKGSGRLELAQSIANADNPLTAARDDESRLAPSLWRGLCEDAR